MIQGTPAAAPSVEAGPASRQRRLRAAVLASSEGFPRLVWFGALALTLVASSCGDPAGDEEAGAGDPTSRTPRGQRVYLSSCAQCHDLGLLGAQPMPVALESARARTDLFEQHVAELAEASPRAHEEQRAALEAVLREPSGPARFRAWLAAYLRNPRFDRTESRMNPVALSAGDFEALIQYFETRD